MTENPDSRLGSIRNIIANIKGTKTGKALLSTRTAQLGKAGRFAVFQVKLWSHCIRLLKKNRCPQQAAALSYHTIFGLIPVVIIGLLIFQLFPAHSDISEKLKAVVYHELRLDIEYPDPEDATKTRVPTDYLDNLVEDFFTGTHKGSITVFSVVLVIWAAFALLSTIERSFNNIWHVARGRGVLHRIINYWAILTLGPLLVFAGIFTTTEYTGIGRLLEGAMAHIAPVALSYVIAMVAFFLLYFVLPSTKVNAKAAIWGAAVAALIWIGAKSAFGFYVTQWKPYSTVYGMMALIPVTVWWIFVTWLIVLFGLQLTFTTQHLKTLDAAEIAAAKKTEEHFIANDLTAINIVREIALAFEQGESPLQTEALCSRLDIPGEFGGKILSHFVDKGILVMASGPRTGYLPAKDPANIKLSDIAEAVAAAGFAQTSPEQTDKLEQIVNAQRLALASYSVKQILKIDHPKIRPANQEPIRSKPAESESLSDTNPIRAEQPPSTQEPT